MGIVAIMLVLCLLFFLSYTLVSWFLQRKEFSASSKSRESLGRKILCFLLKVCDYFDERKKRKAQEAKQAESTAGAGNSGNNGGIRYCPYCDSKVPNNAWKCWHCKNRLPVKASSLVSAVIASFLCIFVLLLCIPSASSGTSSSAPAMSRSEYVSQCRTISYEKLARNPDSYKGDYFKFTGEVVQVLQQGNKVQLRVNVTPETLYDTTYYSDTIYVVASLQDDGDRILEQDIITLYGVCDGLYTYKTVLGSSMSIPKISAAYWDVK